MNIITQRSTKYVCKINNIVKFQHRSKVLKWAEIKNKKWHTERALTYFDDFYQPVFDKLWPSIRLALLCPSRHCAILNNFSSVDDHAMTMLEVGAYDMKTAYDKHLPRGRSRNAASQTRTDEEDERVEISMENEEEKVNEEDNVLRTYGGLNQFVQEKVLTGLEDYLDETDYVRHYDTRVQVPFERRVEQPLTFPECLKMYVFNRQATSSFPSPKRDSSNFFGYYLLDAASVLPVLFLNVSPGDRVLDLCSAPGGKALTLLQTLIPVSIVCNDISSSRLKRLHRVLEDYIPDYNFGDNKITITQENAEDWKEFNSFDKVLVDVPCTNDRLSVNENDNSIFAPHRLKERIKLPEHQINMLYSALRAVKTGGTVVYSTCSLSPIQNDGVVHMALKKIVDETNKEFVISDLKEAVKPFNFLYRFQKDLRYGQLVLPFLPLNYGPLYFAKMIRTK